MDKNSNNGSQLVYDKLTKGIILSIPCGSTSTFRMRDFSAARSASSYIYRILREHPRNDVGRYRCSISHDNTIAVTAVPV